MQQIVSDFGLAQSQYYVVAIWYNTHAPPAVCAKRLFFVTWQPRVWKKWVRPSVKYRRQGRTGLPASKKEGRKLQIFNLAACWWGLPRADEAHNLMCFAT